MEPVEMKPSYGQVSLAYLPDSLIRDTLRYEYARIKEFAYRTKLTRELYRMFFINPAEGNLKVINTQNSVDFVLHKLSPSLHE